jgi:hypothetical protein
LGITLGDNFGVLNVKKPEKEPKKVKKTKPKKSGLNTIKPLY